jgi:hypothetical protein
MYIHEVHDVEQPEMHADELLVPERIPSEIYIVTDYFKKL